MDHSSAQAEIRRTSGAPRVIHEGDRVVIEIPRGLTGAELEHTVVDGLRAAREELRRGADLPARSARPDTGNQNGAPARETTAAPDQDNGRKASGTTSPAKEAQTAAVSGSTFESGSRVLTPLKPILEGQVYEGTEAQIQAVLKSAADAGMRAHRDPETGVWHVDVGDRTVDLIEEGASQSTRKRHTSDPPQEYQYNATKTGPLTDPGGAKAWDPAAAFFGGAYDELILDQDMLLYRVGSNGEGTQWGVGRWYTDAPLQSEAQFRIDTAVKPVWKNKDGTVATQGGTTRAKSPAEASITVRAPKGTKLYRGPVSPQSDIYLGGPSVIQYYVADPRQLQVEVIKPFAPDGHVQPPPQPKDAQ